MPVDQTVVVNITCDNPDCPGNPLDPHDRTGWLFVTSEIYGEMVQQHVFCSNECASAAAATGSSSTFAKSQPSNVGPMPSVGPPS